MSELKCPFCQKELEIWHTNRVRMYACPDLTCKGYYMSATKDMWQELIRTRKALDKAKLILKNLLPYLDGYERLDVEKALEQIKTALEQKD